MRAVRLGIGIGTVLLVLGLGAIIWYQISLRPYSRLQSQKSFLVKVGDPASQTILSLNQEKLIRSYLAGRIYYKFFVSQGSFRPGVYYLSPSLSTSEIFSVLIKGPKDIKITFPEGWRREQYAARLKAVFPQFDSNSFLHLSATLEGQLFPDTYYLPASSSPQKVVSILTANFAKKSGLILSNSYSQLTGTEVLILASLVERETNNQNDRGLVAGILLKRLKNHWPLQIDATVQYAHDTRLCQEKLLTCDYWQPIYDTKFSSPFNTYLFPGLPPAPISNPGATSIQAVLNPISSDYWYYLTGRDGNTYFAKDLQSHQVHIDTYL